MLGTHRHGRQTRNTDSGCRLNGDRGKENVPNHAIADGRHKRDAVGRASQPVDKATLCRCAECCFVGFANGKHVVGLFESNPDIHHVRDPLIARWEAASLEANNRRCLETGRNIDSDFVR